MQLGSLFRGAKAFTLIAALLLSLAVPAIAAAAVNVPPGATEGDQYFEEIPNGGGSGKPNAGGTDATGGSGGGQPVAASQALSALGPDGKRAAALANANTPPPSSSSAKSGGGKPTSSSSTEGEGGMGFWFPLLLIVTALAAAAYGLRRRLYPA
jgi:hypothetical protein